MIVQIDIDVMGFGHWIATDPEQWLPVHMPDGSGLTTVDQMLIFLNDHPEFRGPGGWLITNQLPGENELISRWQRLVRACNGPDATEQARSLGLTE